VTHPLPLERMGWGEGCEVVIGELGVNVSPPPASVPLGGRWGVEICGRVEERVGEFGGGRVGDRETRGGGGVWVGDGGVFQPLPPHSRKILPSEERPVW